MRLCVRTQVYQIEWNNARQRPLRHSGSFKVTDFGTNRKLIYDFLLVINTINLPPILHRFVKFLLARGECLTLTLWLRLIPCQCRHKWYTAKTTFFGLHFCRRQYWCWCIFNYFYVIRPEIYDIRWNYASVRAIRRSRSPSLLPISSYAT